jgi:hypothetical protein
MNWKLWLISKIALISAEDKSQKQDKPRGLPQEIGRHLVVEKSYDPDWVWSLKYVRKREGNSKSVFNFRIFDPQEAAQNNVNIKDYESLTPHTSLVLFEGRHDQENRTFDMESV